jgi:hypothetical protein
MKQCGMTLSEGASEWPEAVISVKMTMNPYIYALAMEKAHREGLKPWEYINLAVWEKLGKPSSKELTEFAATLTTSEDDPKWLKRLGVAARFEVESGRTGSKCADGGEDADHPL